MMSTVRDNSPFRRWSSHRSYTSPHFLPLYFHSTLPLHQGVRQAQELVEKAVDAVADAAMRVAGAKGKGDGSVEYELIPLDPDDGPPSP